MGCDPLRPTQVRIHYPRGHAIALRGDGGGLRWDVSRPAQRHGDTWTIDLPPAADGRTRSFDVKPMLATGPGEHWSKGSNYAVRAGAVTDIYPYFAKERGGIKLLFPRFHSHLLNNERDIHVYLPPSFDENPAASYPLIVMHDGQNVFWDHRAAFGASWRAADAIDALIARREIPEAVIVAVDNVDRFHEYTPSHAPSRKEKTGGGARYLEFLIRELMPEVKRHLHGRIQEGRDSTILIGSSLGGLITLLAAELHPDVFGRIGALSPSTWFNDGEIIRRLRGIGSAERGPSRLYVDSGDAGPSRDGMVKTRELAVALNEIGYKPGRGFGYLVKHGDQHNERAWARRLPGALKFLLS
jgi:predicted alpha/beta superfamily hydrolase